MNYKVYCKKTGREFETKRPVKRLVVNETEIAIEFAGTMPGNTLTLTLPQDEYYISKEYK